MNKGDMVRISAIVRGHSNGDKRVIRRYVKKHPLTGIVLGYSFIKTGEIVPGRYYDEPNSLSVRQHHKVLVVEPFEQYKNYLAANEDEQLIKTNRYLQPVKCYENDLELIGEKSDDNSNQRH